MVLLHVHIWALANLVCLCQTTTGLVHTSISDFEFESGSTPIDDAHIDDEGSAEGCSPCQCQCQCDYSTSGHDGNHSREKVVIEEQLSDIQTALEKQSESLSNIEKQVGFVQHDLESTRPSQCPEDFLFDRQTKMCFKLYVDKLTWAEAQRYCQHLGPRTHLAVVDTQEQLDLITGHLRHADNLPPTADDGWDRQVWLGGMKDARNGQWFWATTGVVFNEKTNALWGPNEPNNDRGNQDCLTMAFGPPFPRWLLNDSPCSDEMLYLCERYLDG